MVHNYFSTQEWRYPWIRWYDLGTNFDTQLFSYPVKQFITDTEIIKTILKENQMKEREAIEHQIGELTKKLEQLDKPSPKERFEKSVERGKSRLIRAFNKLTKEDQEQLLELIDKTFK